MLQINVPRNPTPDDCALALRLLVTAAGPAIMAMACETMGIAIGSGSDEEDDTTRGPIPPVVVTATVPPPPTAAVPLVPGAAPELDSKGFPWDERVNSGNKTKNQDGSWKGKKGVDDATKEAVKAQLRAAGFGVGAAPPAPAATVPPPPVASVVPPAPVNAVVDFPFLMQQYTALSAGGKKLSMEDLNTAVTNATGGQANNAVQLNALADKATYFPIVLQYLQQAAAAKA